MKLSKNLPTKKLVHWKTKSARIMVWLVSTLLILDMSSGFTPFHKANEDITKPKWSVSDLIKKAQAESLSAVNVENTPLATTTSTTVYTVQLNATAGNFTAGHNYFIYFELGLGSDTAAAMVDYQVKYGASVIYTGSVEPNGTTASTATQVSYIDVYTQPGTAVAITVGFKANSTSTAGALNAHLVALDLDENMIENYDYYYNENTSAGAHTTTMTSKATITLNNADGLKDWVVFGMENLQVDNAGGVNAEAQIYDGSTAYMVRSQEGADTSEQYTFAMIVPFSNTARGTVYSVQVRDSASGTQNDHTSSAIFALALDVFESHGNKYTSATTGLGSSMTQIDSLSYTPTTAGNQVVLTSYTNDVAAADVQTNDQLQQDGTTVPTSWSWAQLGTGKTSYDATDIVQSNIIAVVYQTAQADAFDLDAQEVAGTLQVAKQNSITVFSTLYNYMPRVNNWRWYADDADATPGTAYAAENTAPDQIEMGKSIPMKLRVNFTEVADHLENNNRKKLYYATGTTGPWTAVGATSDTGVAWRYYNGGGTDNGSIPSKVLSDSHSTSLGIHNESNSDSPSNSDHPNSTTVEFEYSIENYSADANTTYYFGFFDQTTGLIPLASGKTFPSLTTASAYTLTVDSAPSAVDFGSWQLGSSAYASYDFTSGEKIQFRDNRGVDGSGNSAGWSLTADMTTELYFEVTPASCSSVTFNGAGLNDMTISTCGFTGTVDTNYRVQIDGLGGPFDTFKWSDDGGSTWDATRQPVFTIPTVLNNDIYIIFGASTGHTLDNYWDFTAYPAVNVTITKANTYWITGTLTGLFDAPTTGIATESGAYMTSAVTAATVSGSGKNGLGGFTIQPTMRVYNASQVGTYTGVITFTLT